MSIQNNRPKAKEENASREKNGTADSAFTNSPPAAESAQTSGTNTKLAEPTAESAALSITPKPTRRKLLECTLLAPIKSRPVFSP